jgi:hypothetical protein
MLSSFEFSLAVQKSLKRILIGLPLTHVYRKTEKAKQKNPQNPAFKILTFFQLST